MDSFGTYRAKTAKDEYWKRENAAVELWKADLRAEYSEVNDAVFNLCYAEAYARGHSAGYDDVANYVWDVVDFAKRIVEASKNV